jgi:hypothetical protein
MNLSPIPSFVLIFPMARLHAQCPYHPPEFIRRGVVHKLAVSGSLDGNHG